MKSGTSFVLGAVAGVLAVFLVTKIREAVREEDVEALKDRISDSLASLEEMVSDLSGGLSDSLEAH